MIELFNSLKFVWEKVPQAQVVLVSLNPCHKLVQMILTGSAKVPNVVPQVSKRCGGNNTGTTLYNYFVKYLQSLDMFEPLLILTK